MADLRKFVAEKALDLQGVLRADITAALQALTKHIEKLVLTTKETLDGPVLEVSGDVDLFGGGRACNAVGGQGRNRTALHDLEVTHGWDCA
jgi:hypothetical protein